MKGSACTCVLFVFTISCVFYVAVGYSGASFSNYEMNAACDQMVPGHGKSAQPALSPPYKLEVPVNYIQDQSLIVKLSSTDGSTFRGFMLQARIAGTNTRIGEFTTIPSNTKHNCQTNGKTAAVSHSSGAEKNNLQFSWTASGGVTGTINFVVTVVKTKEVFWQTITSNQLTQFMPTTNPDDPSGSNPTPVNTPTTSPSTEAPTIGSTQTGVVLPEVDPSQCGLSKSCYRQPQDCAEKCAYLLTWMSGDNNTVKFEFQGTVPSANHYIAIGLSNDDIMGDDSVVECIVNAPVYSGVRMSFNNGHSNTMLSDSEKTRGLVTEDSKVSYKDGQLICQFTRYIVAPAASPAAQTGGQPVMAAQSSNMVFDLNKNYNLLLAKGVASSGAKDKHTAPPLISPQPVNFASPGVVNIGGTTGFPLVKAHGIMMIIAWMISASIAIMMPRYHKNSFNEKKCCGKDIWFQIHQPLMLITATLTIVAFIIIFVSVRGYAEYPSYPENVHPPLGIVTTFLVILNPLMAACRCDPHTSKRPIFNWLHLFVGEAAHICAVATIFISTYMSKAGAPDWAKWVLVAFIAWHVSIEIVLTIHKCFTEKKTSEEKYEMNSRDQVAVRESRRHQNRSGSKFKPFMIILHALGVIACALALIIPIAMA